MAVLTMSSKTEKIVLSDCEDNFLYFFEQFEARMPLLKLAKVHSRETI